MNRETDAKKLLDTLQRIEGEDGWRELGWELAKRNPEFFYQLAGATDWEEIDKLLRENKKIQAIKLYHTRNGPGYGLKDAKEAIDARQAVLGIKSALHPDWAGPAAGDGGALDEYRNVGDGR